MVHLDHDLGNEFMVDSNRIDSGMEVVRFLIRNNHLFLRKEWLKKHPYGTTLVANENPLEINVVSIHSWNIVSAPKMQKDLRGAGYFVFRIPFGVQNWDIGNRFEIN